MRRAAKIAARYKPKDEEKDVEDDDGEAAAMMCMAGPPSLCMAFKLPDEDECIDEGYITKKKEQRERIIGKLRNLSLNVEQVINRDRNKLFLNISADDSILKEQAQERGIRIPLQEEKYGGAMCMYSDDLNELEVFAENLDGSSELPFTSLIQLEITDRLVRSNPYDAGDNAGGPIDPERLMETPEGEDEDEEPEIIGYFYMHYERDRQKLYVDWPFMWKSPQPLERVRVYFGEKVALFFTFYGFYMTMLWLPALWGLLLFSTQLASHSETQSWENPYMLVYAVCMSIWASLVPQLWKRLEGTRRYEWDTLDFEEQETDTLAFKLHPETLKKKHVDECTDVMDEFYFDEGSLLPPRGRKARVLVSILYIMGLCVVSGCISINIYALCQPLMSQGDTTFGASIVGFLFTVQSEALSVFFRYLLDARMHVENWRTETQQEDAMIMRSAVFKLFTAYFGIFFIAFAANRIPWAPHLRCPGWQCMPVVQGTFSSMMVFSLTYRLLKDKVVPAVVKWARKNNPFGNEALKKKANLKVVQLPMEAQLDMQKPREIVQFYEEIVVQFGYIGMFGFCFPLVGFLALGMHFINLRAVAGTLLHTTQRPPYKCASDIGAWQDVLNIIALMTVVTNAGLCGLTGHAIYFYKPDLSYVDRLWMVAILEHVMLLIKILVDTCISPEPDSAVDVYLVKQNKKIALLDEHGIAEDLAKTA